MITFIYFLIFIILIILVYLLINSIIYNLKKKEDFEDQVIKNKNIMTLEQLTQLLENDISFRNKFLQILDDQEVTFEESEFDINRFQKIKNAEKLIQELKKIPEKYDIILKSILLKVLEYNRDKEILKKQNYELYKPENIDNFHNKQDLLKKKILEIAKLRTNNNDDNIIVLKNNENGFELMLKKMNNNKYYLSINGKCLKSNSRNSYSEAACNISDEKFLFDLLLINSNKEYNKQISLSGVQNDLVTVEDQIEYPFYLISPVNLQGHAVFYRAEQVNNRRLISIRPVVKSNNQRFREVAIMSANK